MTYEFSITSSKPIIDAFIENFKEISPATNGNPAAPNSTRNYISTDIATTISLSISSAALLLQISKFVYDILKDHKDKKVEVKSLTGRHSFVYMESQKQDNVEKVFLKVLSVPEDDK